MKKLADKIIGEEGNQRNKEWFGEECAKIISENNSGRKRMLHGERRANCEGCQELRWKENRICKKERKEDSENRSK
jgi:hypothetical protein